MPEWRVTPAGLYVWEEPKHVGEITVLEPPKGDPPEIGFMTYQVQGTEISREPDGEPITDRDSLKVGDIIYAHDLLGLRRWTVKEIEGDEGHCITEPGGALIGWLEFGKDMRKCWALVGSGNLKGLHRLELTPKPISLPKRNADLMTPVDKES